MSDTSVRLVTTLPLSDRATVKFDAEVEYVSIVVGRFEVQISNGYLTVRGRNRTDSVLHIDARNEKGK